ncbi:methyltransferase domain-containing protein, partial [Vibrio sp. 704]
FVDCGHDVIAMDYSAEAVNLAKSQLGQHQDKVMLGDVFNADFSRAFDVIYERAFLAALPREIWGDYFAMIERLLPSITLFHCLDVFVDRTTWFNWT